MKTRYYIKYQIRFANDDVWFESKSWIDCEPKHLESEIKHFECKERLRWNLPKKDHNEYLKVEVLSYWTHGKKKNPVFVKWRLKDYLSVNLPKNITLEWALSKIRNNHWADPEMTVSGAFYEILNWVESQPVVTD